MVCFFFYKVKMEVIAACTSDHKPIVLHSCKGRGDVHERRRISSMKLDGLLRKVVDL